MEHLITLLPIVFSLLTGILISWGIHIGMCLFSTIKIIQHLRGQVRHSDLIQMAAIVSITSVLSVLLFFVPQFAATHMITIVFVEIWYMIFLFFVSETAFMSETNVKELKHRYNETVIHFEQMRKHSHHP